MKRLVFASLVAGLGLSSAVALVPTEAAACGGFFCDGGPQPMPVDQTGEDILFIADGDKVEVHIRVEYEGEAENFAWVIPTLSIPTDFSVGSEALIDNIKAASVPTYGIATQPDDCSLPSPEDPNSDDGAGGADTGGTGAGTDGGEPGPTIYKQELVGAFEITVLGGGTVEEVMTWLAENGYQQDPAAEPILAEYLEENHYFAAIKLQGGADIDELHPIALKFDHSEPCVPLRLTRIAASEDMDVRTYFLGQNRVVPDNYRHVLVNPLKIDWPNQAANYKEVITRAVDADEANGRAFVTEYAGPSDVVSIFGLVDPNWNANAFIALDAVDVPTQLMLQGLLQCGWDPNTGEDSCAGINPMVDAVLGDFLPVPDGVDPWDFYNNTAAYEGLIDLSLWDGQAFADLLTERVIEPGQHAEELLTRHPYLTRMYTTISPHEMTEDPMFYENPDLEEVVAARTATNRILCSGGQRLDASRRPRGVRAAGGDLARHWRGQMVRGRGAGSDDGGAGAGSRQQHRSHQCCARRVQPERRLGAAGDPRRRFGDRRWRKRRLGWWLRQRR